MELMEEIGLYRKPTNFERKTINGSGSADDVIRKFYHQDIDLYESLFLLLLNQRNETIGYAKISQGGITGAVVDVRIIAKYCIEALATGAIIAHNHPSGNTQPSGADISITKKTKEVLSLLDVKLFDRLIITKDTYYSFADEGLL